MGRSAVRARGWRLNNAGQVVGEAYLSDNVTFHPFLYSGGVMTDLGTLGGARGYAQGINDLGQVVGVAQTAGGLVHPFLYSGGVMTDLGTLGGARGYALGINDLGQVVGYANTADGAFDAFIDANGTMQDLNSLVSNADGFVLSKAFAINDAGQITGLGFTADGVQHAFLLTPASVPEPASLVMLAVGALAVLGSSRFIPTRGRVGRPAASGAIGRGQDRPHGNVCRSLRK